MRKNVSLIAGLMMAALPQSSFADPNVIENVSAQLRGESWTFDVTLKHADTGWDHYADAWEVRTTDGEILGTRELLHPHVNEQPFTRSLSGVVIPDGTESVVIHARCSQDGWAGEPFVVSLNTN